MAIDTYIYLSVSLQLVPPALPPRVRFSCPRCSSSGRKERTTGVIPCLSSNFNEEYEYSGEYNKTDFFSRTSATIRIMDATWVSKLDRSTAADVVRGRCFFWKQFDVVVVKNEPVPPR